MGMQVYSKEKEEGTVVVARKKWLQREERDKVAWCVLDSLSLIKPSMDRSLAHERMPKEETRKKEENLANPDANFKQRKENDTESKGRKLLWWWW